MSIFWTITYQPEPGVRERLLCTHSDNEPVARLEMASQAPTRPVANLALPDFQTRLSALSMHGLVHSSFVHVCLH